MTAPRTPAGWHPDPNGLPTLRWWDGEEWTDQLAPLPTAHGPSSSRDAGLGQDAAPERVLAAAHVHAFIVIAPLVAFVVVSILVIAPVMAVSTSAALQIGAVFAVLIGILEIAGIVTRRTTTFTVTTRRVKGASGLLRRREIDTRLSQVEGVSVERPLLGTLFGFGTITVRGTGGTRARFDYVRNYQDFRQVLDQQVPVGH